MRLEIVRLNAMEGAAVFSTCKRYRYFLGRTWDAKLPAIMFVGLNPSTADASKDDPTIRRCIRFAADWGYGSLLMANLFAYRSTEANVLWRVRDPVGPRNNWWLAKLRRRADAVIAAWGIHGDLLGRGEKVMGRLPGCLCLGVTKEGHPRHPLYLAASTRPCLLYSRQ